METFSAACQDLCADIIKHSVVWVSEEILVSKLQDNDKVQKQAKELHEAENGNTCVNLALEDFYFHCI